MHLNTQQISLQIAERLRELATRQGNVPFRTGNLRKAHTVSPQGVHGAVLSASTPYARAVHDGRPALTIRPKGKKALHWRGASHPVRAVRQPARAGNPWLRRAVDELQREGVDFLAPRIGAIATNELNQALRKAKSLRIN